MKLRRRVLAIILALLTTIAMMPSCAWADGFNPEKKITVVQVNPIYDGIVTKSALLGAIEENEGPVAEAEQVYSTIEDAGSYVRAQMKKRAASVTFKADIPGDEVENIYAIAGEAMKHTGVPDEGDYILWQYAGYEAYLDIGSKNYEITFEFAYYTDQEQEAQVTAAVDDVLAEMGEKDTYETIRYIYDYITDTVSYDHVHSATYQLSHTAYAAAIEHTAVCQGYAALLYRMLLEEGIDSRIIAGLGNSENHGWNIVKIGPSYYNLDATWDAGKTSYSYFLKNNDSFGNHQRMDFTRYGAYDYTSEEFNKQYPMAASNYGYCTGEHEWKDVETVSEAGCEDKGLKICECSKCHSKKRVVIPASHVVVVDEAVAATCTETGLTEGSHCSRCNEVLKQQKTVPAKAHDWDAGTVIRPATEFEEGQMEYTCSRCGGTYQEAIPELGHEHHPELIEGRAATCGEPGQKDYYFCQGCGMAFEDIACESPITDIDNWLSSHGVIKPIGRHKGGMESRGASEATCTTMGYTGDEYCSSCSELIHTGREIPAMGHSEVKDPKVPASVSKAGSCGGSHCSACGAVLTQGKDIPRVSSFGLSTTTYTWNGKVKKPSVKVKDSKGKVLKSGTDYTVTYASGRKNVGKYKVTVKGKGDYSFTQYLYFKINPKGTYISSLSKGKKYFTVKWKKQSAKMSSSRISGYQIRYSTSSKMTGAKTVSVSGYSKYSRKISGLKAKKKYYVQVRTYRTVNGTKYYSSWSAKKSVKTK